MIVFEAWDFDAGQGHEDGTVTTSGQEDL